VAVKRTGPGWTDTPEGRERLRREARAAAALNHPRLAAVHDVIETEQGPHVVMEYVEGETLAAVLKRGAVPTERALQIGIELAEGLAVAHAGGVIHRDLKPGNVMLTVDGHVKILDFGLARQTSSLKAPGTTPLTVPGGWLGTPGYCAPEQLLGHPADERSDLFSLGAVLYELFTGARPFDSTDAIAMAATMARPVTPPARLRPEVARPVSDLIVRLLHPEPSQRPRSAEEVRTVLSAAYAASSSASTAKQALGGRRVPRRTVWIALGLLAIVVAGVAYYRWRQGFAVTASPARPLVLAVLPLENMTGDRANEFLGNGFADSLITDLSTVPGLTVLSRAAVREAGAGSPSVLASDLGANWLLGGSVQGTRDRFRVNLALTGADGTVAWSRHFDGSLSSVLDLQPQLAQAVGDALPLRVGTAARERLARAPTNNVEALAAYWRGRQLLENPDDEQSVKAAIDAFNEAVTLDPRFASAYAGLADASWSRYTQTRDASWVSRTLDASQKALDLDPNQPAVWVARATVHRGTGATKEALEDIDRALQQQPAYDDALRLRARTLSDLGRHDEAAAAMQQALALRPDYWGNHEALGSVFWRAGRRSEAIDAYQKALGLKPDVARVHYNLGIVYQDEGQFDRALAAYKKAASITPAAPPFSAIGTIEYARGDYAAALQSFQQAARLAPNFAIYQRNIGDTWVHLQQPARAKEAYRRAADLTRADLKVNPNNPEQMARLAVYLAKSGEFGESEQWIERSLAGEGRTYEVYYRDAVAYAIMGRGDAALEHIARALGMGASRSRVQQEEDFAALRGDPRFKQLLANESGGEKRSPR
ncbi:MAG: protein kinase domain-containing protein, partial [Acidobacteriota bacterium]